MEVAIALGVILGQAVLCVLMHRFVKTFGEYTRTLARANASNENLLKEIGIITGARPPELAPLPEWQEDQFHDLREESA